MTSLPRRFVHASYAAAAQAILEATKQGPGLVVLTGAAGTGKTTLALELAEQFERDGSDVAWVTISRGTAEDLLRQVGLAFGLEADSCSRTRLLSDLADRIASGCRPNKPAILIIDGAQDLAPRDLPELCYLGGLTGSKIHPVQILLTGRDQVWELLDRPDHAKIRQRILATCRLYPLTLEETATYIVDGLEPAGWQEGDPDISADAVRLIYQRTGGVPRLISLTLGHLLLHGRQSGAGVVESRDVEWVLAHLGQDAPAFLAESTRTLSPTQRVQPQPPSSPNFGDLPIATERERSLEQHLGSGASGLAVHDTAPALGRLLHRMGRRDRRWVLGGLAVAALAAYFVVDLARVDDEPLQSPEVAEPRRVEASAVVPSAGAEPAIAEPTQSALATITATAPSTALETADQAREAMQSPDIALLLSNAEFALSIDRLMVPPDDNAYGYYREVLALDPRNDQARAGIQRIVKRYGELARQSLRKGNSADARRFASRGLTLEPKDRDLLAIQRQASRPREKKSQGEARRATATEQEAPTVLDRIGGWLRSGRTDQSHFLDH